jgi:hypothetical protein
VNDAVLLWADKREREGGKEREREELTNELMKVSKARGGRMTMGMPM